MSSLARPSESELVVVCVVSWCERRNLNSYDFVHRSFGAHPYRIQTAKKITLKFSYLAILNMAKRKFVRPKDRRTATYDQIRTIIRQNLDLILSTAERQVGQRVGDMFIKAAVAIGLALIPSPITQGISVGVLTGIVTGVIRSSTRKMI